MSNCRHEYEGDHGSGWQCRLCGDRQQHVPYSQTVAGRAAGKRLDQAQDQLDRTLRDQHRDIMVDTLIAARWMLDEVQSLREARAMIRAMIRAMLDQARGNDEKS